MANEVTNVTELVPKKMCPFNLDKECNDNCMAFNLDPNRPGCGILALMYFGRYGGRSKLS